MNGERREKGIGFVICIMNQFQCWNHHGIMQKLAVAVFFFFCFFLVIVFLFSFNIKIFLPHNVFKFLGMTVIICRFVPPCIYIHVCGVVWLCRWGQRQCLPLGHLCTTALSRLTMPAALNWGWAWPLCSVPLMGVLSSGRWDLACLTCGHFLFRGGSLLWSPLTVL